MPMRTQRTAPWDGALIVVSLGLGCRCSVVRVSQEPQFLSAYDPEQTGSFIWLDLPRMAKIMGITGGSAAAPSSSDSASSADSSVAPPPVLLDALEVRGSNPVRFMRRRVPGDYVIFTTTPMIHTVYAATWFTLSAALVALTYIRFKKRIALPARKTNAPATAAKTA